MEVIAIRQLHGTYGTLMPGERVYLSHSLAQKLLKAGLVKKYEAPEPQIESSKPEIESSKPAPEQPTKQPETKKK